MVTKPNKTNKAWISKPKHTITQNKQVFKVTHHHLVISPLSAAID